MSNTPGGRMLELRVSARPSELKTIREAVRTCADRCGCNEKSVADIVLAIDEACQNIIRHAYGGQFQPDDLIVIEIDHVGNDLIFSLTDSAPTIDPDTVKPRDLDDVRPGGLGTHFIRQVMDEATFTIPAAPQESQQDPSPNSPPGKGRGNLLRMVRRID